MIALQIVLMMFWKFLALVLAFAGLTVWAWFKLFK